jgi:hypothetical protein
MTKTLHRIVLSTLLATLTLTACADRDGAIADDVQITADDDPASSDGIGTSPSDPGPVQFDKLGAIKPCGLWIAATYDLAEARHTTAPSSPDMEQFALPGGLACSALIAARPLVEASFGGVAVVRYVDEAVRSEAMKCTGPRAPDGSCLCWILPRPLCPPEWSSCVICVGPESKRLQH